jgi:hypothetical protein
LSASERPQLLTRMSLLQLLEQPPQELKYLELNGLRPDVTAVPHVATPNQSISGLEFVFGGRGQLMLFKSTSWEYARRRV